MEQNKELPKAVAMIDFAIARTEFLDSFADLEAGVAKMLEKAGAAPSLKEPFSHRLKAFKEIDKVSVVAKCRIGQRNSLAAGIAKILPIRADIVHSRMHVNELDGRPVALFVNAQLAPDQDAPARILTLDRLQQLTKLLAGYLAKLSDLKRPINPASSPPQPLPDVAGGP